MKRFFFIVLISLFLVACGLAFRRDFGSMMPLGGNWWRGSYPTNGSSIYYTVVNDRGQRIPYTGGPRFGGGMMMGASLACISCHGVDGHGGMHPMHMQIMYAPDIRYSTLSGEGDEHGDEHSDEHGEYDIEAFRQAVVYGRHPDASPLNLDMPRWQMSDDDLVDLLDFLKSLP